MSMLAKLSPQQRTKNTKCLKAIMMNSFIPTIYMRTHWC